MNALVFLVLKSERELQAEQEVFLEHIRFQKERRTLQPEHNKLGWVSSLLHTKVVREPSQCCSKRGTCSVCK